MQFYVKDIMSTDVITINKSDTLKDVIKTFVMSSITGAPVVDNDETIIGVISDSDILQRECSHSFYQPPLMKEFEEFTHSEDSYMNKPASRLMSKDLYTIEPDDSVSVMAKKMYDKKVHRLLVTEYEKLIGVVTTYDLLKLIATSDESVII